MERFASLISIIAMWAPLLPLAVGIARVRKLGKGQFLLLLLVIFFLLNQGVAEWFSHQKISNFPLFHLHIVVEFIFLSWLYFVEKGVLHGNRAQIIFSLVFASAGILNAAFGEGLWNAPSGLLVVESCILIVYVGIYYWKVFREMKIIRIEGEFLFWVSLGILLFFAGTLLVSAFFELLTVRKDVYFDIFLIREVLIILTNICYAIAMLCKAHPQKS